MRHQCKLNHIFMDSVRLGNLCPPSSPGTCCKWWEKMCRKTVYRWYLINVDKNQNHRGYPFIYDYSCCPYYFILQQKRHGTTYFDEVSIDVMREWLNMTKWLRWLECFDFAPVGLSPTMTNLARASMHLLIVYFNCKRHLNYCITNFLFPTK